MNKVLTMFVLAASACAHKVAGPLPSSVASLNERMRTAGGSFNAYSCEARITYFGKEGRAKGSASLVTAKPASMRYELHGPHGGTILAFATDGERLTMIDFKKSRFVEGPATPETIDHLIQFAPLHLSAPRWVDMLFGQVVIDSSATLSAEKDGWMARWIERGITREVAIDPETSRVKRMRASVGNDTLSEVEVRNHDASGLPTSLHIEVPASNVDMTIELRDVARLEELDPTAFVLEPPAGVTIERAEP
ncbi:MAG: hypothetical protein H7Z43_15430 [Clostridia bacterium]|nr:hypothetical protein [Deltaproteobacteria bacterium]